MLGRYWALADMGGPAFRRALAFLAVVALCGTSYASVEEEPDVIPIDRKADRPVSDVPSNSSVTNVRSQLRICECEPASGSPSGLSCEKEGYFQSGYEREGSWLSGGGLVPLSHAICCRLCMPEELPPTQGPISKDDRAVAIMSMGCHASSGSGPFALQCEPRGNSLVTALSKYLEALRKMGRGSAGWAEAVLVSSSIDAYYPLGSAACCTPSLLLESGSAWELERCDCVQSGDINCGGIETHRFLTGFDRWRMTRAGQFVPIAPANCCKMCLSDVVRPIDECADLNMCSGHGMCVTAACECMPGWSGADCSNQNGFGYQGLPQWLISLIIMCSCATLCLFMLIVNRLVRFFHMRAIAMEGEDGEQMQEPLLPGLGGEDDDGSVGSEDTTDDDSEADEAARLVDDALAVAAAEEERDGEDGEDAASTAALEYMESPSLLNNNAAGAASHSRLQDQAAPAEALEQREEPEEEQVEVPSDLRQAIVAVPGTDLPAQEYHEASDEPAETVLDIPEKQEEAASQRRYPKGEGPPGVPGRDCNVCMVRAVQVALIPCGHACMCRRCSRRLSRCPVCRKEILRRQRLFI